MTASRFHCPVPLAVGMQLDLPERIAHHAGRVLRMRAGDALTLFDGNGGEYSARITAIERSRVRVELHAWSARERESPIFITLVQALQAGSKMDMTVQKAVELGASRIVPVWSKHSAVRLDEERAPRRLAHWRAVAIAACEQCGRNRLAEVLPVESLDNWLARSAPGAGQRLLLAPKAKQPLTRLPAPVASQPVEVLVGAEGGIAPEETELAVRTGFQPVCLGPRILRSETAGLAALAAIQLLWGDLKEETTDV